MRGRGNQLKMEVKLQERVCLHPYDDISRKPCYGLKEDFAFHVDGVKFVIPAGFIFDGASTPRFFAFFLRLPREVMLTAALIHDYLYRACERENGTDEKCLMGVKVDVEDQQKWADEVFRIALVHYTDGVSKFRAKLAYWGLRIGGKSSFRSQKTVEWAHKVHNRYQNADGLMKRD